MVKWSGSVKTKWTPPPGLFTRSSREVARVLIAESPDLRTAIARLAYYVNRAGSNLSSKDKARLSRAADLIRERAGGRRVTPLAMQTETGMIGERGPRKLTELERVNRAARRKRRR